MSSAYTYVSSNWRHHLTSEERDWVAHAEATPAQREHKRAAAERDPFHRPAKDIREMPEGRDMKSYRLIVALESGHEIPIVDSLDVDKKNNVFETKAPLNWGQPHWRFDIGEWPIAKIDGQDAMDWIRAREEEQNRQYKRKRAA